MCKYINIYILEFEHRKKQCFSREIKQGMTKFQFECTIKNNILQQPQNSLGYNIPTRYTKSLELSVWIRSP